MTAELLKIVLVADVSDRHQIQKILQQLNQTQIELIAIASLDNIKLHQCVSYQAETVILLVISRLDAYGLKVVNQVRHIYAGFPLIAIGDTQNQALICEAISIGVQEYLIAEQVTSTILLQKLQFANARWQWLGKRFEDLQRLQSTSKVSLHSPLKECCCRADQRISVLAEINTFRQIVTHCNDAIAIIDLQGYYLQQNAMHQLLLGYSDEDLDGKTPAIHLGEQVFSTVCQELVKNDRYCCEVLSRTKSGKLIHIELKAFTVRDEQNQPVCYVGIKKDITERKLVTSVVTQRDRLLEGVAAATNQLLTAKDFTQAVYKALETLGKAVQVNRVYVFENHTDPHSGEPLLSQRFEWTDNTVTPEIDNPELQNLSYLNFLPRWYQLLSAGNIVCGLVKDFPETERQVLEPQDIISILIVPIFIEDSFWGFVGFDECRYQRQWQESEEAILIAASGSIGAAIVRKRTEEALRKTEAKNSALLNAIPDAMFRIRKDGIILDFKGTKNFDLYVPEDEFIGKNLVEFLPESVSKKIRLGIKKALTNCTVQLIEYQLPIQGKNRNYEARMVVCGEDEVVSIVRDISERKQVEIELRKSKEAIENVSKAKSEFLATMSHELRTPLNAILGLSQLLHQEIFGSLNAKQKEYVSCIYSSGEHLLSLINDILDLSKVEAGKEELMLALVQVPELCETCLAIVRDRAIKKGLQLTSQLDPQAVCCFADERRVKQMLLNLLTNAIKFTPSGKVTLRVQKVPQGITFTVSDTGIGIASEHLKLLFQPFKQLDSRFNRQYEGTGLGLALTRKLAHLHGGNVTVKSTLGKGSDFTLLLPDYPQPTEDEQYGYNQQAGHLFNCSPRILISGNGNHGSIIQSYLKAIGYEVKYLKVTNNILAQIEKFKPKLILLDPQLSENVTTVTLIQHLKAELDQTIPIVVITQTTEKCDRFLEAGAQECLNKPIGIAQLESLLMRYL
ncbi:ATP-binding protein [Gloeocapsopsis sp. IPPAS B-1203]|uniref:ATP-binding protein n=1 Tax=Gloeocapsopsis sp. IPPAS B-1203 TaxID=2049454 RepID=UPI000C18339D|nr:ATP-binding protein [Gloeocapsopsis sp. IPPAS B-1203]PIG90680.1 hybrid sensor histidine kinase/response regulator [Gloeocapsopsis sp. IPPAS B-1203]